ncbi:MAG: hypothetical protein H6730_25085 [Deltaproteobacteria bacterium]|nr:hypothetical protein [Deltaproteobacteria bacterium]
MIVDGPDGRTVAGVEGAPFSYQEHTAEAVTVTVLEYAFPLEALGLREGPIDLLLAGQEGLHPPVPAAARRAVLDGSGTFALEPILVTDVDLEPLLLEVPSRPACIEGGGCLVARPIDDVLVCRTPCPEPPEPTPPMPPTPPELGPCLAGWVAVPPATDDDVPECAPWAASSECEAGTAQRPGEATCTPVGAACPTSGRFAPGLPDDGSVRFVDSSAAPGGTGTRAAPFARLDDALAGAGSSTVTVALSVGTHAAPAAWPAQVELRGRARRRRP